MSERRSVLDMHSPSCISKQVYLALAVFEPYDKAMAAAERMFTRYGDTYCQCHKLRNGARALHTGTNNRGDRYVLAWWGNGGGEFIVWSIDQDGDTYNGHYYATLPDAIDWYLSRF